MQGLLTMLFFTHLTGGNPPLFMDFRKVWESWEVKNLIKKNNIKGIKENEPWLKKGFVDGDNSGSASFDWAAKPGASVKEIMKNISFPLADPAYFPGMGNSITYVSPGGLEGIAGRLAYSSLTGMFTMCWDEAFTVELPEKLSKAVCNTSNPTWPHTFVVPKYASMVEYKQYVPANHLHMIKGLKPKRLEYWMDLTNVLSGTPWADRPAFIEGTDRPLPLLYIINGGETTAKLALKK
jgi:L-fucose isomerase